MRLLFIESVLAMLKPRICALALLFLTTGWVNAQELKEPIPLFDSSMSMWEVWIGVPHPSVKGLPEGTETSENFRKGKPLGLSNDPRNVFSMIEEDGKPVLRITGEVYGGLTTVRSYQNYHLSVQFRWGEKKYEPRLKQRRDSGIVYHATGDHGKHANAWKQSLEFQVQEKDMGDFIGLVGAKAKLRVKLSGKENKTQTYEPTSETIKLTSRYTSAAAEPDLPNGHWNHLELYVSGDRAVHVVNGDIVLALHDAVDRKNRKLTSGQIQLQAEGAECYYRDLVLSPITDAEVPDAVVALLETP